MLRRAARSIPAAFLALLWVLAPLLGAGHGIGEKHVYCPDHGVLEEADADGREATSTASWIVSAEPRDHEACAFAGVGANNAVGRPTLLAVTHAPAPPAPHAPGECGVPPPVPLLLNAPKSSPPA